MRPTRTLRPRLPTRPTPVTPWKVGDLHGCPLWPRHHLADRRCVAYALEHNDHTLQQPTWRGDTPPTPNRTATMNDLPKIHAAVVAIPNPDDPESIAQAAAHAALELLVKVSAKARGNVRLDRVALVQPVPIPGRLGATGVEVMTNLLVATSTPRHAVMVSCRVVQPEQPTTTVPDA